MLWARQFGKARARVARAPPTGARAPRRPRPALSAQTARARAQAEAFMDALGHRHFERRESAFAKRSSISL